MRSYPCAPSFFTRRLTRRTQSSPEQLGQFLGVCVGHGAAPHQWTDVRKMRDRIKDIQTLCIGTLARAYMHSCYVASLFRYKSQFAQNYAEALREYTKGMLRLLKAPWNSIPYQIACNLRLWGLPTEFLDLRRLNLTTRLITASGDMAQGIQREIYDFSLSVDAAFNTGGDHGTPLRSSLGCAGSKPSWGHVLLANRSGGTARNTPRGHEALGGPIAERWEQISRTLRRRLARWTIEPEEILVPAGRGLPFLRRTGGRPPNALPSVRGLSRVDACAARVPQPRRR